ncbi:hypothetical protein [Xanthomonas campestris]|uniref:hypothetical protein n=1 Tax=Xanthomonas campestris TaxID=339 RepID=UPI001FD28CA9|nr:hypothetical protein [Xanthomonas campestris]
MAQGPGSKAFHFAVPICSECNNAKTQPADLAFDQLCTAVMALVVTDVDPAHVLEEARFAPNGALYLDSRRYFAKLLCCHLAELGAPHQHSIADFAIGISDANCISLEIDLDSDSAQIEEEFSDLICAAHGGLIIFGEKETFFPKYFYSTLSIGPTRYKYHAKLTTFGQMQLANDEPDFVEWCCQKTKEQLSSPPSE